MTESRQKRLIMAGTVTAVLLAAILLVVLVYQWAALGTGKAKRKKLQSEIAGLQEEIASLEDGVEKWQKEEYLERKARQLGMYFKDDKEYRS